MKQDEIIEMAKQADKYADKITDEYGGYAEWHELRDSHFAKLVAAKERELCITDIQWHIPRSGRNDPEYLRAKSMIERIRARGEA